MDIRPRRARRGPVRRRAGQAGRRLFHARLLGQGGIGRHGLRAGAGRVRADADNPPGHPARRVFGARVQARPCPVGGDNGLPGGEPAPCPPRAAGHLALRDQRQGVGPGGGPLQKQNHQKVRHCNLCACGAPVPHVQQGLCRGRRNHARLADCAGPARRASPAGRPVQMRRPAARRSHGRAARGRRRRFVLVGGGRGVFRHANGRDVGGGGSAPCRGRSRPRPRPGRRHV